MKKLLLIFLITSFSSCIPVNSQFTKYGGFRPFYISKIENKIGGHKSRSGRGVWPGPDALIIDTITYNVNFLVTTSSFVKWRFPIFVEIDHVDEPKKILIFNQEKYVLKDKTFYEFSFDIPLEGDKQVYLGFGYFGVKGDLIETDSINLQLVSSKFNK